MNHSSVPGLLFRSIYRLALRGRWLFTKPISKSFGNPPKKTQETVQQIYVINLDRQVLRWHQMQEELRKIYCQSGQPLIELTKRFSAIDAKDFSREIPNKSEIETHYTLADQLFVEPQPTLSLSRVNIDERIDMTRQEVAVALSHIEIWKQIAAGKHNFALVLEDDVYFKHNFPKYIDQAWEDLRNAGKFSPSFDLLYLSYEEVKTGAQKSDITDFVFKPYRGLWYLSGYVLSRNGARKLLSLLPVRGPVDLWINHQFENLKVYATSKSIINQRLDLRSSNLYSILPILSKIGVLTKEKPVLFETKQLKKPVFVFGEHGTGLTSLAMALSMLGYRCCSDINELPVIERENLFRNKQDRVFDAYVNVQSLEDNYVELAQLYPEAKFIILVNNEETLDQTGSLNSSYHKFGKIGQSSENLLVLPSQTSAKWKLLCEFLECNPPVSHYPLLIDQIQRKLISKANNTNRTLFPRTHRLKFDTSPWIAVSNVRLILNPNMIIAPSH
jgi:GR25 family glycosyltransferase involved in LPS biosynthesis